MSLHLTALLLLSGVASAGPPPACEGPNLDACVEASRALLQAQPPRPADARAGLEAACARAHRAGCADLAALLERDEATAARATDAHVHACNLGVFASCTVAGARYALGRDTPRDPARALHLLERGCQTAPDHGCVALHALTAQGLTGRDAGEGARGLYAGCEQGQARACLELASVVEEGKVAPADPTAARRIHARACELGEVRGCHRLFRMVEDGIGGPVEPHSAVKVMVRACEHGDATGCRVAAERIEAGRGVDANPALAGTMRQRYCALRPGDCPD